MFTIRIAEMNICIDNKFDYTENMCKDYLTSAAHDFVISVSEDEIKREMTNEHTDVGYCESLAIYRKIAEKIILQNGFLIHAVAADVKGDGILFMAKSGTGKSTHAALWKKLLGSDFSFVNGDKPLIKIKNKKAYAHGTPWAGKENLHTNMCTHVKKAAFIIRSDSNECEKLSKKTVLERLLRQIYIPAQSDGFLVLLSLINDFIGCCDFYDIKCNTDIEAAKTAFEVIFDE